VSDLNGQVFQHLSYSVAGVVMGVQVLLHVELGKSQTYSLFLPWKLGQKVGQTAAAFREVCRRALLVYEVIFKRRIYVFNPYLT